MKNLEEYNKKYETDRFFEEIWDHQIYESALSRKHEVVLDVGALAGEFSFWMIQNGSQKVHAIEPLPSHYKELTDNIKLLGLKKEVIPYEVAIASDDTPRSISDDTRGGGKLFDLKDNPVECISLAAFLKKHKIDHVDVLKIDVEDAESEIFNAGDFPSVVDRIDYIIGEHLPPVHDLLVKHGFIYKELPTHNFEFYRT